MVYQEKTKIISNDRISKACFRLTLNLPKIACTAVPGQFVSIRVSDADVPLLRRPFSIHRLVYSQGAAIKRKIKKPKADAIEILYEVVGKGSEILSRKIRGEYLDVIGPLGKGFILRYPYPVSRIPILVAGGMGVAPLVFLAEKLVHSPQSTVHRKIMILLGAKTKSCILCEKEFKALGCEVKIATDDGSKGFKGKVTDLLSSQLSALSSQPIVYACGPKPMLEQIAVISKYYNIPAQISLEAHMACGLGACLGCVVNTKEGFKRVCKDGPVFNADEIIWEG